MGVIDVMRNYVYTHIRPTYLCVVSYLVEFDLFSINSLYEAAVTVHREKKAVRRINCDNLDENKMIITGPSMAHSLGQLKHFTIR